MTQDDFPNIKQFMEHCCEYFGRDIRPSYIEENGLRVGKKDLFENAVIQEPLENLEGRKVLLDKGRLSGGKG